VREHSGLRGRIWFHALTSGAEAQAGNPASVVSAFSEIGIDSALFLCVVPNPESRFPCVRDGQVGLEEAYALAAAIRAVMKADEETPKHLKRPVIAIVDVKSQAYGRREETAGIFLAAAMAADAYAAARMAGHPVIALIVGHAFSGGFLTHGYQANLILALDDDGVVIHAMHKEAAARVTRRSVADLERLGHEIAPMSYDVRDYAKLGLLHQLLHVSDPLGPHPDDIDRVRQALEDAIDDARRGPTDLSIRMQSPAALETRRAGIAVRALMFQQWDDL
jgi:malonate decarboxylase gamma subunit